MATSENSELNVELELDKDEPLLMEENMRFTVFPIQYHDIWQMYKRQLSSFWTAEEIDFSEDYDGFVELSDDEKMFVEKILAFFAASDGIVNFNLRERFLHDIKIMEAQLTYGFQMMMEGIHGEVYSLMLDNIIKNTEKKNNLFNAITTISSVKLMADWAVKWINSEKRFPFRLIAFAIVEGVFFSGSFAAIYWLKIYRSNGKKIMKGLTFSNELISRDEGMHTDFACLLYSHIKHKLTLNTVKEIMTEAVEIAKTFYNDAIPCKMIGMNEDMMNKYIEYIADRLMVSLGYDKIYNSENPFEFMELIGISSKTNFFESRVSSYQRAYNENNKREFKISDDF